MDRASAGLTRFQAAVLAWSHAGSDGGGRRGGSTGGGGSGGRERGTGGGGSGGSGSDDSESGGGGGGWRDLPWRRTRDPWAVLVSEVMLQQTQVARVVPRWQAFLTRFPDPASCAVAPVGEVIALWVGLGYNQRAVRLHRAAAAIVAQHGGHLPATLAELQALPGIGPYTARAVMAFAFAAEVAVVDTNAARVLSRAVAGRSLGPAEVQAIADLLVPRGSGLVGGGAGRHGRGQNEAGAEGRGDRASAGGSLAWRWNQAMLDLGARHCTAGVPACSGCPLSAAGHCAWARAGYPLPDPAVGSAGVSGRQSAFVGSDRQGRGRLVRALRDGPVPLGRLEQAAGWPDDPARTARAVASLVADGLAVRAGDTLTLP